MILLYKLNFKQNLKIISTLLFLMGLLSACNSDNGNVPKIILNDSLLLNREIEINNWRTTGNISTEKRYITEQNSIEHNFLKTWNLFDSILDDERFEKLSKSIINTESEIKKESSGVIAKTEPGVVTILSSSNRDITSVNYAACNIFSEKEQNISFILGSNFDLKVWVNNCLVLKNIVKTSFKNYQNIVNVHLKKGNNFILVKTIMENEYNFHFYLRLASISKVRKHYIENTAHRFLLNPVVKSDEALELGLDPSFFSNSRYAQFQMFNSRNEMVFSKQFGLKNSIKTPLPDIEKGAYLCKMIIGDDVFDQPLIYGSTTDFIGSISEKIKLLKPNESTKINLDALIMRYHFLNEYGFKNGFDYYLNRKIARVGYSLSQLVSKIYNNEVSTKHVKGLHLRGYVSKIDCQPQHYQLYVPKNYTPEVKMPLVVITPWASEIKRPFLESWHVADLNRTEMLMDLADQYGYAIIWPNSRVYNKIYEFPPISNTATFEVIKQIFKNYNIDKDRLYLYGACQGGGNALTIASRNPSIFAALGLEGPDLYNGIYQEESGIEHSAIRYSENFFNLPVYIIASDLDEKTSFIFIRKFIQSVKNHKGSVELDFLKGVVRNPGRDMFPDRRNIDHIFSFFKNKKRIISPNKILYHTDEIKYGNTYWLDLIAKESAKDALIKASILPNNSIDIRLQNLSKIKIKTYIIKQINKKKNITVKVNNKVCYAGSYKDSIFIDLAVNKNDFMPNKINKLEGPINDFFSDKFILVKGTKYKKEGIQNMQTATNSFNGYWESNFYGKCIVKNDIEISDMDIQESNLLIIGTSNRFYESIIKKLPISISAEHFVLKNKSCYFKNQNTLAMIYPNPLNPKKYVLFIISNAPYNFEAIDLAYKGVNDYMIWNLHYNIVAKGNFNQFWK